VKKGMKGKSRLYGAIPKGSHSAETNSDFFFGMIMVIPFFSFHFLSLPFFPSSSLVDNVCGLI
jgi:hypothetical protein